MIRFARLVAFAAALAAAGPALAQTDNTLRVRGTVTAITAEALTIQTGAGESVMVKLGANHTVLGYTPIRLEDVASNAYIAAASTQLPDGSLRALSLIVFPEQMRGLNEGTKGWDLGPNSRMTNATVAQFTPGPDGTRQLSVRFGRDGQTQSLSVTPQTHIRTFAVVDRALLVVGAQAVAFATRAADGSISSGLIGIGLDGRLPPV